MKKLIPAIVMLLVSAVVLSTASYAWFTTAQDVSASGMQVTASAPTSVLIAEVSDGQVGDYSSSVTFATPNPTTPNKLYAASSADGKNFFVANQCTDMTGSATYGTAFNQVYNPVGEDATGTMYYMDYVVSLKNSSPDAPVYLEIGDIELSGKAIIGAVRVAIIVGGANGTSYVYNPSAYEAMESSPSWTDTGWVEIADSDEENVVKAQGPINATISANQTADESTGRLAWDEAAKGVSNAYTATTTDVVVLQPQTHTDGVADDNSVQVIIRIWFEGQSASCVTANAGLSADLSITFAQGEKDAASN